MAKACAYAGKSYWATSRVYPIQQAISNERLKRKGLIFPIAYYLRVHSTI